jgi:serine protease Do
MRHDRWWYLALLCCSLCVAAAAQDNGGPTQRSKGPLYTPLDNVSASMVAVSRRISPCVVQIFSTSYSPGSGQRDSAKTQLLSKQRISGAGTLLSKEGWIMTNAHVVEGTRRVKVLLASTDRISSLYPPDGLPDRKTFEAKVVSVDRETDLALLKIDGQSDLPYLSLADSDTLQKGQLVLAFGSPLGLENSVSLGIISSVDRQISAESPLVFIQTDAAINPGNSGGPLVDTHGHVVGINTFIFTKSGGSEGIGFAIPSNVVRTVYTQMRNEGHVHHHQIGVFAKAVTPALASGLGLSTRRGVLIEDVVPQGPGDVAGLKVGDVVVMIGHRPVRNIRQFALTLYGFAVGEKADLTVLRGKAVLSFSIAVVERKDDPQRFADMVTEQSNAVPGLGILALEINDKVRPLLSSLRNSYGVLVAAITGETPYTGDALEENDVIYSVNGKRVGDVETLRKLVDSLKRDDPFVVQVERLGTLMYLVLEID